MTTPSSVADKAGTRTKTAITVAKGDGIGPEIMDATLQILTAAGAALDIEEIEIGEKVYNRTTPPASRTPPGNRCAKPKSF